MRSSHRTNLRDLPLPVSFFRCVLCAFFTIERAAARIRAARFPLKGSYREELAATNVGAGYDVHARACACHERDIELRSHT